MINTHRKCVLAGSVALIALGLAAGPVQAQQRSFNVPAQRAADAIPEFARQAGVQIIVPDRNLPDIRTPAIIGQQDARAALRTLIAETGLAIASDSGSTIILKASKATRPQGGAASQKTETPQTITEVVVTGTRTRGGPVTSPVAQLSRADIANSGYGTVGEALQTLPQVFSGGQTPTNVGGRGIGDTFNPTSFSTLPNLRGLGADSTLTLIDGHRMAFDGTIAGSDISIVPASMVERVDVMTDGASALYGSDAVAGVVNVILRRNFTGAESTVRYGGTTGGGHANGSVAQLFGTAWTGGNAVIGAEYRRTKALDAVDRDFAAGAGPGFQLAPAQEDLHLFASVDQEVTPALSVYGRFLGARRLSELTVTSAGLTTHKADLVENASLLGVKAKLPAGWTADVSGNLGRALDHFRTTNRALATRAVTGLSQGSYKSGVAGGGVDLEGPLARLPSGEIRLALGGGLREETLKAGSTIAGNFDRRVSYGYAEASAPLVRPDPDRQGLARLDVNAAVRYERYSDFGGAASPKVGVLYAPLDGVNLKASWGKSFRAPTLSELYAGAVASLYRGSLFGVTSPTSATVLISTGSNPDLGAQNARSFTAGFDVEPRRLGGIELHVNYFNIRYSDRIALPITVLTSALKDPVYAPFVIRSPSAAASNAVIARADRFFNNAGAPFDTANVTALLLDAYQNVALQTADGWDVSAAYAWRTDFGGFRAVAAGTWIDLSQRLLEGAASQQISGTIYNVPSFKGRAGLTWTRGGLMSQATLNYISGATNPAFSQDVGSWTTFDLLARYAWRETTGALRGTSLELSLINLLDRAPPAVDPATNIYPGLAFDPSNASPFGRSFSITLRKTW